MTKTKERKKPGRKRKYTDTAVLQSKIDEYFTSVETPTVTGLALHLGFTGRQALIDYGERPEFADTVKKARARIEGYLEKRLVEGKPPIGLIFSLKNNFGWKDKNEVDVTSNGETMGVVVLPANPDQK